MAVWLHHNRRLFPYFLPRLLDVLCAATQSRTSPTRLPFGFDWGGADSRNFHLVLHWWPFSPLAFFRKKNRLSSPVAAPTPSDLHSLFSPRHLLFFSISPSSQSFFLLLFERSLHCLIPRKSFPICCLAAPFVFFDLSEICVVHRSNRRMRPCRSSVQANRNNINHEMLRQQWFNSAATSF